MNDDSTKKKMMVTKFNIGSAHNKISYGKKEKVFKVKLPDHILEKKAAVRRFILSPQLFHRAHSSFVITGESLQG